MAANSSPRKKSQPWKIRIYIRQSQARHQEFLKSVQEVCHENGLNKKSIDIVNVDTQLTEIEQQALIALPLLLRVSPPPISRVIGFAQPEAIRESLGFKAKPASET
jgi:hypothetical protein